MYVSIRGIVQGFYLYNLSFMALPQGLWGYPRAWGLGTLQGWGSSQCQSHGQTYINDKNEWSNQIIKEYTYSKTHEQMNKTKVYLTCLSLLFVPLICLHSISMYLSLTRGTVHRLYFSYLLFMWVPRTSPRLRFLPMPTPLPDIHKRWTWTGCSNNQGTKHQKYMNR